MQANDYEVQYRKGTLNENDDCLSRADIYILSSTGGNNRDMYNNEALFKYITTGEIMRNSSSKRIAQLKIFGQKYKYENDTIYILIDNEYKLVPPPAERKMISLRRHTKWAILELMVLLNEFRRNIIGLQ